MFYTVHEKRYADPGTPRTMRIDYHIGFNDYKSEWVCPEHTGYARRKFEKWWNARAAYGCRMPSSAREAVALADQGLLAQPKTITVKSVAGEKFERIANCVLGERPVMREPGDDSAAINCPPNSPHDLGGSAYGDEIPF